MYIEKDCPPPQREGAEGCFDDVSFQYDYFLKESINILKLNN